MARPLRFIGLFAALMTVADPSLAMPPLFSQRNVFQILAAEKNVQAFRLGGTWTAACDSMDTSSLGCLEPTLIAHPGSTKAITTLVNVLQGCTWVRHQGGGLDGSPTLGFHFGGDSLDVDLVVWLFQRKALLSRAGEGRYTASLQEGKITDLTWCLWAVDPERPALAAAIAAEMHMRGLSLMDAPPPDVTIVSDFKAPEHYFSPAVTTRRVDPVYPEMAREARIEGRVVLNLLIDKTGRLQDVKVRKSVTMLDQAAVNAVRHWAFEPAVLRGKPIDSWLEMPIDFHLEP
jgi:TonB family protein